VQKSTLARSGRSLNSQHFSSDNVEVESLQDIDNFLVLPEDKGFFESLGMEERLAACF
jgi:hypothetical protein